MKLLRTLSTRRLIAAVATILLVAVAGTVAAVAARGGSGPTPPPEPLPVAIHDALTAQAPVGISARIRFTNTLFPSGALLGQTTSPLIAGATGRLWATSDGGRLELQSDAGDAQIVWNNTKLTVYDGTSNTAYVFDLPQQRAAGTQETHSAPTIDEITKFLADAAARWSISGAQPDNVAGREAYRVDVSPKQDGGLLGSFELAWDAARGVPLRVAVYAKGASSPALALEATDISFGPIAPSTIDIAPPANAKVVDFSSKQRQPGSPGVPPVTGAPAVRAAAPWAVLPDALAGRSLQDVRLVGPSDSRAVTAVYGQGLGAVVVLERQKPGAGGTSQSNPMGSLPTVTLNGTEAHELSTQLGTALTWERGGVAFVLAGSVPSAVAEASARALG